MASIDSKRYLGISVYKAAQERISKTFDEFEKISLSFSGGKDSSVMFHMVMDEAKKRNRKIGLFFLDWEVQFEMTINHVKEMIELYKDYLDVHWVALPIVTSNAASMFEPEWIAWEPGKEHIRTAPDFAITDINYFPFYTMPMTFEEFVPSYNKWYANGEKCACFVGLRTSESLNRWRAIANEKKSRYKDWCYTTKVEGECYSVYPLYDWKTEDIWIYNGTFKKCYNLLYTRMHQAGIGINQQRICEYFSEHSKRSLYLFNAIEPQTWGKIVGRVNGANLAAMTANEKGRFTGEGKISKPENHTWKSYVELLLNSMPAKTSNHYKNKITVWIKFYRDRDIEISDELEGDLGSTDMPSWRRVARMILRGDYWASMLSFGPTKTSASEQYNKMMAKRRADWDIYNDFK